MLCSRIKEISPRCPSGSSGNTRVSKYVLHTRLSCCETRLSRLSAEKLRCAGESHLLKPIRAPGDLYPIDPYTWNSAMSQGLQIER